jgi:hypothetical protein
MMRSCSLSSAKCGKNGMRGWYSLPSSRPVGKKNGFLEDTKTDIHKYYQIIDTYYPITS